MYIHVGKPDIFLSCPTCALFKNIVSTLWNASLKREFIHFIHVYCIGVKTYQMCSRRIRAWIRRSCIIGNNWRLYRIRPSKRPLSGKPSTTFSHKTMALHDN